MRTWRIRSQRIRGRSSSELSGALWCAKRRDNDLSASENWEKVLQVTKSGRASPDENLSLYWLLTLREAWLRTMAFDFEGARQTCQATCNVRGEFPDGQYYAIDQMAAGNIALPQGKYSQALEHF